MADKPKLLIAVLCTTSIALTTAGCSSSQQQPPLAAQPQNLTASTTPQPTDATQIDPAQALSDALVQLHKPH